MTATDVYHEIVYPHALERVWRALTDSSELAAWLMDNDIEPRIGHRFTFREAPDPPLFSGIVYCEITDCRPCTHLAYTWSSPPNLQETLVSFTLTPVEHGTRLVLTHTGFSESGATGLRILDVLAWGWGDLFRNALNDHLSRTNS